jgi:hypothetical protein
MQEALKALQDQYEVVQINSKAFFELRTEIEKLEQQIKDVTDGVVPQTQAINLQAKGLHDVNFEYGEHSKIMRRISPVYNDLAVRTRKLADVYDEWSQQLEIMNYVGEEFGSILTSAFSAALVNGESFFDTIKMSFKNYIAQMVAMTAATTALAVAIAFVTGGTNFTAAFNKIGGGMGLPFGFGDDGNLNFRINGFDLVTGPDREAKRLLQLGAYGK